MRRRSIVLALVLLTLASLGTPVAAAATGPTRGLDVATLDARIAKAQARVERWYGRIEGWYELISRTAARIERLEGLVARSSTGGDPRGVLLDREPLFRLAQANRRLQATLRSPRARHVQAELDAWSAFLAELVRARERALHPAPEEAGIPSGGSDLGGRGPVTYESWAGAFLEHLGAPVCGENLLLVVAWETAESTTAAFNPLATTRDMPGATDMNSVGVKNFVSLAQGLDASRDTLLLGAESYAYGAIVDSLRSCRSAAVTARAINASAWCRGCVGGAYITGLLPIVRGSYGEHAARLVSTGA